MSLPVLGLGWTYPVTPARPPRVRFWHAKDWNGRVSEPGKKGGHDGSKNIAQLFVEDENGNSVEGTEAKEIRETLRSLMHSLVWTGQAASTYDTLSYEAKVYIHVMLSRRWPFLLFCEYGTWKINLLIKQMLSGFASTHIKTEGSDDEAMSKSSKKRRRNGTTPLADSRGASATPQVTRTVQALSIPARSIPDPLPPLPPVPQPMDIDISSLHVQSGSLTSTSSTSSSESWPVSAMPRPRPAIQSKSASIPLPTQTPPGLGLPVSEPVESSPDLPSSDTTVTANPLTDTDVSSSSRLEFAMGPSPTLELACPEQAGMPTPPSYTSSQSTSHSNSDDSITQLSSQAPPPSVQPEAHSVPLSSDATHPTLPLSESLDSEAVVNTTSDSGGDPPPLDEDTTRQQIEPDSAHNIGPLVPVRRPL